MSKAKLTLILSLLIPIFSSLLFSISAFAQTQTETEETLTFTTYYPAPYGVYNELRLFPHTPASSCDSTKIGTMYYDSAFGENQIKVCTNEGWKNIGGGVLAKYEVFNYLYVASIPFLPAVGVFNFTVPAGVTKIMVEVWGGGGSGGRVGLSPSECPGGGAGGYGKGIFTVTSGDSYLVTVGAGGSGNDNGGSSSFGSLIICNGGNGALVGGAGGTCSAPINVSGGDGDGTLSNTCSGGTAGGGGGAGGRIPGGGGNQSAFGANGRVIVWY